MGITTIAQWLSEKPRHTTGIRTLQFCIGAAICFRIATELPFARYLWGPDGIAADNSSQQFFGVSVGSKLDTLFYSSNAGIYSLIAILLVSALLLMLHVQTRAASLFGAFALILLELRLPAINDGGDNISRLVLLYMVLIISNPHKENLGRSKIWVHNIGVAAIILQLVILYATSGFMKATGEKWQNGTAMYIISHVEWFSLPGFREMFTNPAITTFATYVPMTFMILFPVAIFSRFKFLWIGAGICFHMGIAYFMGLLTFSLVMIGLELFLISDQEYSLLSRYARGIQDRIIHTPVSKKIMSTIKGVFVVKNILKTK